MYYILCRTTTKNLVVIVRLYERVLYYIRTSASWVLRNESLKKSLKNKTKTKLCDAVLVRQNNRIEEENVQTPTNSRKSSKTAQKQKKLRILNSRIRRKICGSSNRVWEKKAADEIQNKNTTQHDIKNKYTNQYTTLHSHCGEYVLVIPLIIIRPFGRVCEWIFVLLMCCMAERTDIFVLDSALHQHMQARTHIFHTLENKKSGRIVVSESRGHWHFAFLFRSTFSFHCHNIPHRAGSRAIPCHVASRLTHPSHAQNQTKFIHFFDIQLIFPPLLLFLFVFLYRTCSQLRFCAIFCVVFFPSHTLSLLVCLNY